MRHRYRRRPCQGGRSRRRAARCRPVLPEGDPAPVCFAAGTVGCAPARDIRGAPRRVCHRRATSAASGVGGIPDQGHRIHLDGAHGQERDDHGREGPFAGGPRGRRSDPRVRGFLRNPPADPGIPPGIRPTMTWADLDWDALDRHRDRFLAGKPCDGPYWTSAEDLASYDVTFGERIGWKWDAVLDELRMRGWAPSGGTVLDWGCGSGIAGRRVVGRFGSECFESLVVWDHSPVAANFAHDAAMRKFPGLPVSAATPGYLRGGSPIGLLIVSHVLNELPAPALDGIRTLIARSRAVIWTEHGSRETSRALGSLRDEWTGEFHVIAPCTHGNACPVLGPGNARHWCHHFAAPPPGIFADSNWVKFGQRAGIDLRSLPYSFVALVPDSKAGETRLSPVDRQAGTFQAVRAVAQLRRRGPRRADGDEARRCGALQGALQDEASPCLQMDAGWPQGYRRISPSTLGLDSPFAFRSDGPFPSSQHHGPAAKQDHQTQTPRRLFEAQEGGGGRGQEEVGCGPRRRGLLYLRYDYGQPHLARLRQEPRGQRDNGGAPPQGRHAGHPRGGQGRRRDREHLLVHRFLKGGVDRADPGSP